MSDAGLQSIAIKAAKKPTGKCVFCGGGNLSHEHFWPDWAYDLLPGTGSNNIEHKIVITEKNKLVESKKRERQGAVKGKTLRVVCETCNNGWMSRLEEELKPTLIPLIKGRPAILSAQGQYQLARWITLKTMVGEQNERSNAAFTQGQRDQLRILGFVPPQIMIWIGDCGEGGWATAYAKDAGVMSLPDIKMVPKTLDHPNVMFLTFGVGRLLVHARLSNAEGLDFNEFIQLGSALTRLWPPTRPDIVWPTKPRITADQAGNLAMSFQQLCNNEKVIWKSEIPTAPE